MLQKIGDKITIGEYTCQVRQHGNNFWLAAEDAFNSDIYVQAGLLKSDLHPANKPLQGEFPLHNSIESLNESIAIIMQALESNS